MTYKQIEACREVRLWIGQIIVPACTVAATIVATNPELRESIKAKIQQHKVKSAIKKKFKNRDN